MCFKIIRFYIDRFKLCQKLRHKYGFHASYDPCSYPGIMCKFYYDNINKRIQNGVEPLIKTKHIYMVSFMIFRTGSVLIVGKCTEKILNYIYNFIKTILYKEFINIECQTPKVVKRVTIKKIKKRIIQVNT